MSNPSSISNAVKRKVVEEETTDKIPCKYGKDCYRKNPEHFLEFGHPEDFVNDGKKQRLKPEGETLSCVNPYLFTTVKGIDDAYNERNIAADISDILTENCEKLEESVQFNYMIDIPWLLKKYPEEVRSKPLLIVHGFTGSQKLGIEGEAMQHSNIDLVQAKLPIPYGTHHSKMMFLLYSDGFKVVIHTANLVESDWFQKTQGVWVSPLFFPTSCSYCEENDSFKAGLVEYLSSYNSTKLMDWVAKIKNYDMTTAGVHLIASIPGRHTGKSKNQWGHLKLRQVLSNHGPDKKFVTKNWPVVGQFSSIGNLGDNSAKWLCSEWLRSLSFCKGEKCFSNVGSTGNILRLIYPTIRNVRDSLEGYSAGGSLPYSVQLAMKQTYLKDYLCQWVANNVGRSLASPHIKSYTRLSPDSQSVAWFLLTSANLSKAAWGVYEKDQSQLMIRSYEIGVLFTPSKNCDESESVFSVAPSNRESNGKSIHLPFDVPLTSYSPTDKPWVWDIKYTTEDSHGRLWIPR